MNTKIQGLIGEKLAEEYLKEKRYTILERNYRTKIGEIDLIAGTETEIIFLEVKYWKKIKWEELGYSVNKIKQNRIKTVSKQYLSYHSEYSDKSIRFDIIFINEEAQIRHLKNAFSECL